MKKFIFDYIVSSLTLFDNSLLNYIAMAIIGIFSFRIAFSIVGKIGIRGELGSIFHWIIRLIVFVLIWAISFSLIKIIITIINNWKLILGIVCIIGLLIFSLLKSKTTKKEYFEFIIGIISCVALFYIGAKLLTVFIDLLKVAFTEYTTISVALITGLLAFLSVIVGKYLENKITINNRIREEKQKIYIDFLDWIINNVLYAEVNNNPKITDELKEHQKYITIYASDNVLNAWSDFKISVMNSEKNKAGMSEEESTKFYLENEAPKIEKLILEIRKELGYKNKNIKKYDILKLYLNDLNKYDL